MVTPAEPPPPRIPDYELLRLIGRGSYGDVWLARAITGAFRAVKVVHRDRFPEARPYEREFDGITRFAAVSLREPSQLAVLHAGRASDGAWFYYVMELADDAESGRVVDPARYTPLTLREMFARRGKLPAVEVVALGAALARAVGSLHAAGLVHRDIKPSNVILVGGVPKLADVGLVTAAGSAQVTFVGTEGFVPPEGPGTPAADVYSLGKLLYELATGLDRTDFPRLPAGFADQADRGEFLELNEVLLHACEADPQRRYPDAASLLDDLLLIQAGKSVRRLRRAERRLTRALRIAVVLALFAGVAGAGAWIERRRADEEMRRRAVAEAERDALARLSAYANSVGNAQHALRAGGYGKARQILRELAPKAGEPDLRGLEWGVLAAEAEGDPAVVLQAAGAAVERLALAPGRGLLAVHGRDQTVALFRTDDHRPAGVVRGVQRLAGFSADGEWLLGTDAEGRLRRWNATTGSADAGRGPAGRYLLGTRGSQGVVALENGDPARLIAWDADRNEVVRSVAIDTKTDGQAWEFFRGGISPDGAQAALAWVRRDNSAAIFRTTVVDLSGETPAVIHAVPPDRPSAVGVDAEGAWAALTSTGVLWRFGPDREERARAEENLVRDTIRRAADLGAVRIACDREQVYWLDCSGKILRRGRGHSGMISDLVADPGKRMVYSATQAGEVRAWPAEPDGRAAIRTRPIWNSTGSTTRLVFTPDGSGLAVPLDGQSVALLDAENLAEKTRIAGMRYPVWIGPDALLGLRADGNGGLRVASPATPILPQAKNVLRLVAAADGTAVCATDLAGNLWWERVGEPAAQPVATGDYQHRFALDADRALRRLWTAGRDNVFRLVELPSGREVWAVPVPALAPSLALSPDEKAVAVVLENGQVQLHDASTGALQRTVTVGGSTPQSVIFSPDGRRLLVACSRGEILCFETQAWLQVGALQLPTSEALHIMASAPDGRSIAAVTKAGALHLLRGRND